MKTIHSLHRPWKVPETKANKVLSQKGPSNAQVYLEIKSNSQPPKDGQANVDLDNINY